jgi:hypothetical protein
MPYFFAGERYDLLGYVVMPNHLHWVFQPLEQWVSGLKPGKRLCTPRERIVHSTDRFTGLRCKRDRRTCFLGCIYLPRIVGSMHVVVETEVYLPDAKAAGLSE